ncbi:hypothetical protein GCM10009836_34470 [Pseudonocardia ailaonensis]|uniref:Hydantoin racemase n=1 Tax=Pseudonocardia ailaonensis TaxID=367279 RepID=A0ABN2N3Z6_9PSEU
MKIGIVHVTVEKGSEPYTELINQTFGAAKRDDTELMHRYVRHMRRATDTALAFPTLLNKVDVINEFLQLQADGADAVMVACSGDTGVGEARSLLDIPVVGPMEAAAGLAMGYGRRIGIVTVADNPWAGFMDQFMNDIGLGSRYVGLRQLRTPTMQVFTQGFTEPATVAKEIAECARELVEIGAESILVGSAGLSTFASYGGLTHLEDPVVPIFDVLVAGLKLAEVRAELKLKVGVPEVSRAGWTERYPDKDVARLAGQFGWYADPAS